MGEWTGMSFDDLRQQPAWRDWNQTRAHDRPPGGESMLEIQMRVARWLDEVVDRHPDTGVVAVCHSDVIKAGLCHALGLSLENHNRLEISPGSVSIVAPGTRGLKVRAVNETFKDRPPRGEWF